MGFSSEEIGQLIKARRAELGWTQEALAERLGRSLSMIKQMESGAKVKSWPAMAEVAEAIGLTPNDLLGVRERRMPTPDLLAVGLAELLEPHGVGADAVRDIAESLLVSLEAASELGGVEPDHQVYRAAARSLAKQSSRLAGR